MLAVLILLVITSHVRSAPLQPAEDGTVTVKIEDGLLRGQVSTSIWNRTYFSFQNVPYAQPPIGDLRFKSPQKVKPWTGVRDALEQGTYCMQDGSLVRSGNMSEDCLYLNVYIPQAAAESAPSVGLPVMVWIYGGAFTSGAGIKDSYGPDHLMNLTAILVTLNYRVGALGFLSMEHPDVTSNAAMKDQVAALRWVKRNIAQFGGNADQVTIFGESAGGISVDMQLISPMSQGLFHHAISQSGSVMAVDFKPGYNATKEAFFLGEVLGHNTTDADDLLKFLRSVTAEDIVKGQKLVGTAEGADVDTLIAFPVVDAKIQEGSEIFLPDLPENLLRAGKAHNVPYILGFNSEEAKSKELSMTQAQLDSYNSDPESLIPATMNMVKRTTESLELAAKIKTFYFGNETISFTTMPQLINLLSDNFMIHHVHRSAVFHINYGTAPIYTYMFTYDGTLQMGSGNFTIKGPAHAADIDYLFYVNGPPSYNPDSDDMKVIRHFTGMWVDFARSGDPSLSESVKWTPATKTNLTYLQLDVELSVHQNAYFERMAFWDNMYNMYKK